MLLIVPNAVLWIIYEEKFILGTFRLCSEIEIEIGIGRNGKGRKEWKRTGKFEGV